MIFLLDEAVIQRLAGERDIAPEQLDRLIRLAARPNITIELIPFSAGLHPGMLEAFIIVEFPDAEDTDVVYRETSQETVISRDDAEEISGYREVFQGLRDLSLGADGTLTFLSDLKKRLF
jgi:hypothetical protein